MATLEYKKVPWEYFEMTLMALPSSRINSKFIEENLKFSPFYPTVFGIITISEMQLAEAEMKTAKSRLDVLEAHCFIRLQKSSSMIRLTIVIFV